MVFWTIKAVFFFSLLCVFVVLFKVGKFNYSMRETRC